LPLLLHRIVEELIQIFGEAFKRSINKVTSSIKKKNTAKGGEAKMAEV
jgi:hypothetical protein